MSADTDSTRPSAEDAVAAGPLDLLLTDAATGMLRRGDPGRRRPAPGRGAGRQAPARRRAGAPAARRTWPHRRGYLAGAAVPAGPPVRRPGMGGKPAAAPRDAGVTGRGGDRRGRGGR